MQGPVTVAAAARVGRVVDISWAPLPAPAGAGACLVAATEEGGLAFLDACQAKEAAPRRARCLPSLLRMHHREQEDVAA